MESPRILKNFVALEGIDGSGTTTQLNMIADKLGAARTPYWTTCEPTVMPSGKLIRQVLKGDFKVQPESLARFFEADRYEHINGREGILAHLDNDEIVISDRYLFSSLAYQSVDCGFDTVYELNRHFPLPEIVVYIEVPAEIGDERAATREMREIFEYTEFQKKVIGMYDKAFESYANSGIEVLRIDGTDPKEKVFENIWSRLQQLPIK